MNSEANEPPGVVGTGGGEIIVVGVVARNVVPASVLFIPI